jgi:hypothetical protein
LAGATVAGVAFFVPKRLNWCDMSDSWRVSARKLRTRIPAAITTFGNCQLLQLADTSVAYYELDRSGTSELARGAKP